MRLADASAISWSALDRPLARDGGAELSVHAVEDEGVLLGSFQRLGEADGFHPESPRLRRISGGTHLYLAPGSVHLVLAFELGSILPASDAAKIVNRLVRPLLRVFGAAYFGRDCVVRAKKPIGFVGFAHDAASGRAAFEALIPATADWSDPSRASYRGAELGLAGAPAETIDALVHSYLSTFPGLATVTPSGLAAAPAPEGTPWIARTEEAIGPIYAGPDARGAIALGGELMASRDVLASLAREVAALEDPRNPRAVGAAVDRAFADPRAVLFGVRSLASLRDLLCNCFEMRPALTI